MNIIITLIIIGFVAGIFSGVFGIGGAILIVPSLIYFLQYSQHQAQGTSLALLMFPVGILAVYNYYEKGHINFETVLYIAIGFVGGAYLGSKVSLILPVDILKKVFGIFLLYIAYKMIFNK